MGASSWQRYMSIVCVGLLLGFASAAVSISLDAETKPADVQTAKPTDAKPPAQNKAAKPAATKKDAATVFANNMGEQMRNWCEYVGKRHIKWCGLHGYHSDACRLTELKYKHLCLPKVEQQAHDDYVAKKEAYEGEIQSKYLEKRQIEDAAAADDNPDSGLAAMVKANKRELEKDELATEVHEAKAIARVKQADNQDT